MSYGHLLVTQANAVLSAVSKKGLDPKDFGWELTTPTLVHTPSGYSFTFQFVDYDQHQAEYCPGEDTAYENRRGGDWDGQLSLVEEWLTNLKRETQAPDLWSLLSEQTALVEAASADLPNTPFSTVEIGKISAGLRELQAYIEKTQQLDEQKRAFLESKLAYLVDEATVKEDRTGSTSQ